MTDDQADFTRSEAADRLRLSEVTVDRLLRSGELVGYHLGRRVRVRRDSVEQYLTRCRADAVRPAGE